MTHDDALKALQSALAAVALAAGRSYPVNLVQGCVFPAIRWQHISGTTDLTVCGSTEAGDDLRVQVDCFADTYSQMRALRAQVVAAIDAITTITIQRASAGLDLPFEPDGRVYRHTMDYTISLSNV